MSFADTVFYLHNNSVFISCPLEPNEMMVPSSKSDLSGCLTWKEILISVLKFSDMHMILIDSENNTGNSIAMS